MKLFNFFKRNTSDHSSVNEKFKDGFSKQAKGFKGIASVKEFKEKGYPAWAVKEMGYTAIEMKEGGYSGKALKMAGFPKIEIDLLFN